jgi:hypothetical protein
MKKIINTLFLGATIFAIASCSTTTNVTGSWKKPGATANQFKSIFVSALTTDIPTKSSIENGLQNMLEPRLKVYKSIDAFPPDFENTNRSNQAALLDKIRSTNADAIMTVALVDKDKEQRYIPGTTGYNPMLRYGYYGRWSSYWGYWSPLYYTPGYYVTDKTYYLETNIYNAKTEELIWSAQSATYNPSDINSFLKGYLTSIKRKMTEDGLISK